MEDISWLLDNACQVLRTSSIALSYRLCDRCLGRLFGRAGYGLTNQERGRAVRTMLALSQELLSDKTVNGPLSFSDRLPVHPSERTEEKMVKEEKGSDGWFTEETPSMGSYLNDSTDTAGCWLCQDIFDSIDDLARLVHDASLAQEFSTFLVGCRMDPASLERERTLWEKASPSSAEPLKEELNREIGKAYSSIDPDKVFDRENPEIAFLVDPLFKNVATSIKPVFIKGRYVKLVRGIPQTRWTCTSCRGKGCPRCLGKGKMYETSVEEIIGKPLLDELEADDFRLHGMGREDIDVLTLGRGRPFVLEITSPRKRSLDLVKMMQTINDEGKGRVEVRELTMSSRHDVPAVKVGTYRKRYRARISIQGGVDEEMLKYNISLLAQSPIKQRTPWRVSHRRADKVRVRKIHEAAVTMEKDGTAIIDLETDGGLYIKELFHGDEGRTDPSLSSLLGLKVNVETLDVMDVLDDEWSSNDQG